MWLRCPYQGVPGSVFMTEIRKHHSGPADVVGVISTRLPPPCWIRADASPAIRKKINDIGKCILYVGEFQK